MQPCKAAINNGRATIITTKKLATLAINSLEDSKAQNIVSINLKGKSDIADMMIVASGTSNRHVSSIAENLMHDLRADGIKGIEPEGMETGDWVLIDLFDIVVHVMQQESRQKYDLEAMWQVPVQKKRETTASRASAGAGEKTKVKKTAKKPAAKKAPARKKMAK